MREERLVDIQIRLASIPQPAYTRSRNSLGFAALRRLVNDIKRGSVPEDLGANVLRVFTDIDNVALASYYTLMGQGGVRPMLVTTRIDPTPNPDSRVTLTSARDALGVQGIQLDWRLSPDDKRSARRAMEIFANEVGRAGLGRVQITFADDGDATRWPASLEGGWHQMGTTRMSDDPKSGVVDRNCRVHGMANLWVAGSSVFTTGGSGTPTMTIITLAYRLADHIKGQLA
jgi:choline dehydrogenase-like flavoprotein